MIENSREADGQREAERGEEEGRQEMCLEAKGSRWHKTL